MEKVAGRKVAGKVAGHNTGVRELVRSGVRTDNACARGWN
jgi:hypothetical protein